MRLPKTACQTTKLGANCPGPVPNSRPSAYVQAQSLSPERVPGSDWLNSEKRCSRNVKDWLNSEKRCSLNDKVRGKSVDPWKGSYCPTGSYCLAFPIQVPLHYKPRWLTTKTSEGLEGPWRVTKPR